MPWRKYKPKKGKHGPIYYVAKGVIVRPDARGNWVIHISKGGDRKNKTIGSGRESLVRLSKLQKPSLASSAASPIAHTVCEEKAILPQV